MSLEINPIEISNDVYGFFADTEKSFPEELADERQQILNSMNHRPQTLKNGAILEWEVFNFEINIGKVNSLDLLFLPLRLMLEKKAAEVAVSIADRGKEVVQNAKNRPLSIFYFVEPDARQFRNGVDCCYTYWTLPLISTDKRGPIGLPMGSFCTMREETKFSFAVDVAFVIL